MKRSVLTLFVLIWCVVVGLVRIGFGGTEVLSGVGFSDYQRCVARWSEKLVRSPDSALAYNNRAICYLLSGKVELARADLKNALRLSPKNNAVLYNAAWIDLLTGRAKEAAVVFEKLATQVSDNVEVLRAAGLANLVAGDAAKALYFLAKAKEFKSDDAWTLFHLGYAYHLSGETSRAATYFPLAVAKEKDFFKKLEGRISGGGFLADFYLKETAVASGYLNLPDTLVALLKMKGVSLGAGKRAESFTASSVEVSSVEVPSGACVPPYPNRYLFAVVVSSYDELPELPFVKKDKELVVKLAACFLGVPRNNMLVLEDPTLAQIKRKSREFFSRIKKRDAVVFFYYSGHGVSDRRGRFYLLPRDASVKSQADLVETALSLSEVKEKLSLARGMKLVMIDACRVKVPWKPAEFVTEKVRRKGFAVVFATGFGEVSVAERGGRASAFLTALYRMASRGIENLDFDGSGYVELGELARSLVVQVRKVSGGTQKPEVIGAKDIPVFPVE